MDDSTAVDFLREANPAFMDNAPPPTPHPSPKPRGRPRKTSDPGAPPQQPKQDTPGLDAAREAKRLKLLTKLKMYKRSRVFGPRVECIQVSDSDSLEIIETKYKLARDLMLGDASRAFVDTVFKNGLRMTENAVLTFMDLEIMRGTANEIQDNPYFDEELEEISIEVGTSCVPNPYVRLGAKVLLCINQVLEERMRAAKNKEISLDE